LRSEYKDLELRIVLSTVSKFETDCLHDEDDTWSSVVELIGKKKGQVLLSVLAMDAIITEEYPSLEMLDRWQTSSEEVRKLLPNIAEILEPSYDPSTKDVLICLLHSATTEKYIEQLMDNDVKSTLFDCGGEIEELTDKLKRAIDSDFGRSIERAYANGAITFNASEPLIACVCKEIKRLIDE